MQCSLKTTAKAARAALMVRRGKISTDELRGEARVMYDMLTERELEEFAGLPLG
ncbi:DUF3008 family protein [Thioclava sp. SK-1]|uniref:DUF3008 family protein n=1 Tax=Thioclava sp. SK-1 TaxID=1889770 RepID=UPI0009F24120|nr:DUF3008 family protein [Thioclava sp. SK-1]